MTGKWYVEVSGDPIHCWGFFCPGAIQLTHPNDGDIPTVVGGGVETPKPILYSNPIWTAKLAGPTKNMMEARMSFRSAERGSRLCSLCGREGIIEMCAYHFWQRDACGEVELGGSNYSCENPEHIAHIREITKGTMVTEHHVHREIW